MPEFVPRLARQLEQDQLEVAVAVGISLGARTALTLAAFYPDRAPRVVLMCPVSFRPWPVGRTRRVLPQVVADLSTLPGTEVVERLGQDRAATMEFLLTCRSGQGFWIDLRPPTDVTADVRQPTLVLASRQDGSVGMEHPEHLAATLPDARLVEVSTPCHLLWLGDGADETRSALTDFIR